MIENALLYMLLLMVPEQVKDCHCFSYCKSVYFGFLVLGLSLLYCPLFTVL